MFGYAETGSVKKTWDNVIVRAKIDRLTPHCCRHGFATTMLRAGFDPVTVAKRGGWRDPAIVVRTYGHALEDTTVTDAVFDTPVTQAEISTTATTGKKRIKST